MLSIYKREFLTEMPMAIIFLVLGLAALVLPDSILSKQTSIFWCVVMCLIPVAVVCGGFHIKWKNRNRFEPCDDLTKEHINKANEFFMQINQIIITFGVIVIVLSKPVIAPNRLSGALIFYLGLEKLIRYLLFVFIDKYEMKGCENE